MGSYSNTVTKINNATDGYGRPLGVTIDTLTTVGYKCYTGTLASPVIINIAQDLKRRPKGFCAKNVGTDPSSYTIAFSIDNGVTYGDEIPVTVKSPLNFDYWIVFTHMRITESVSTSSYVVVVI